MKRLTFVLATLLVLSPVFAQEGFTNQTKALYIFDITKYIDYGDALDSMAVFKIGMLTSHDDKLLNEVTALLKNRKELHGKPLLPVVFRTVDDIDEYVNVLFVTRAEDYNLKQVLKKIDGKMTFLMTENYDFGSSMFNYIVIDGQPKFEINMEMLEKAGLGISPGLLVQAVKTREDWEELYDLTSEELQKQLELVEQQKLIIAEQLAEIEKQKALLDSLDLQITEKEAFLAEKQRELEQKSSEIRGQSLEIRRQRNMIIGQQSEMNAQRDTLNLQRENITIKLKEIEQKQLVINEQENRIKVQLESIEKQKIFLYAAAFVLILLSFLAYYIYRGYKIKREANIKLEEKNRTITAQKSEIEKQRDLAETQRDQIAYQKKHITDSIMYAKRIQTALLPSLELFSGEIDHFVLYKPLDIVSGDFYWVARKGNKQIVIAADCTGHGVPGAFMSMLGVTMLNEIVNGKGVEKPDEILNLLRDEIIKSLKQSIDDDRVKDGMDMTVSLIDYDKGKLYFAGANNPLILIRDGEVEVFKGDKMPVAIHYRMNPFALKEIDLKKGDCFYMFSDGYGDQFGGPRQKKFMIKHLKETLLEISPLPMIEQGKKLDEVFEKWRGANAQVDDVILIGIRY
ncbi:MAG: YfiR/HmsC family protein [Bacteroidales bacterium]|nr:YfiR/HmsC family protein [Bacteroidales bacterium]